MPSKASTALTDFITGIRDDKLKDIGESQHTIVKDRDFRLDMQGVSAARVANVLLCRRVLILFFVAILDDQRATPEVQPSGPNQQADEDLDLEEAPTGYSRDLPGRQERYSGDN